MALKAKEVAAILGVSQASLSLVINNKPGLSEQTRKRIKDALQEKGFTYLLANDLENAQNPEVADLKNEKRNIADKNRNIGFVTYRVGGKLLGYQSFFSLIIENLEMRARQYGYTLNYFTMCREEIQRDLQPLREAGCAGLVIFATEMKEMDLQYFEKLGIPIVLLDNYFNLQNVNSVKVNNEQGTMLAVDHLWKKGHRSLGYIRSQVDINSFNERYERAMQAMQQYGMKNPEKFVYSIRYGIEESYEDMKQILQAKNHKEWPTAFMVDNDLIAAGAMRAFKEAGYRIPDDISFIGFDDRPVCLMTEPQLTTIRIPRDYFGNEAVEILVRILNGENRLLVKKEISTQLIERDSILEIGYN